MGSYDKIQKILHGNFDIELHKNTFINYLEVIIDELGEVHYAIPSHTEWLLKYGMDKYHIDRDTMMGMAEEHGSRVGTYGCETLCAMLNCVAVWNAFCIGQINQEHENALVTLRNAGLYSGPINIEEYRIAYGDE